MNNYALIDTKVEKKKFRKTNLILNGAWTNAP